MHPSIENIPLKRKPRAQQENYDCIRWAPNGIGFIVTNQQLFSKTVLPKYFKHSNYSSFVRQLNMYNFHKIRETNSESYFHHECFDRDNKNAMSEIKRKPEKKKRKNEDSDDDGQENDSVSIREKNPKCTIEKKDSNEIILSEGRVSIKLIKQDNEQNIQTSIKSEKNTTRNLFSQTYYCNQQEKQVGERYKQQYLQIPTSQKNIISVVCIEDDKFQIHEEIQRIPRFNTNQLFYPSTNNLFPFMGAFQPNTFGLFY